MTEVNYEGFLNEEKSHQILFYMAQLIYSHPGRDCLRTVECDHSWYHQQNETCHYRAHPV